MTRANPADDPHPGPNGPTYAAWEDAVIEILALRLGVDIATARIAFDTQTTAVLLSWKRRRAPAQAAQDIARMSGSRLAKLLRLPTWTGRAGKTTKKPPPQSTQAAARMEPGGQADNGSGELMEESPPTPHRPPEV